MSQASHEFRGSVDFNQSELRNSVFQNLNTPPIGPKQGQIYFDSKLDLKSPFYWNSEEWIPFGLKPIHKRYSDETSMVAGQPLQIKYYIYYRSDEDIYYEYLGTTNGNMSDYNPIGGSGTSVGAGAGLSIDNNGDIQLGNNGAGVIDISNENVFENGFEVNYSLENLIEETNFSFGQSISTGGIDLFSSYTDDINNLSRYALLKITADSEQATVNIWRQTEDGDQEINIGDYSFGSTNINRFYIKDTIQNKGVEYDGDYESNFTARSLVTKQWVESQNYQPSGNYVTLDTDQTIVSNKSIDNSRFTFLSDSELVFDDESIGYKYAWRFNQFGTYKLQALGGLSETPYDLLDFYVAEGFGTNVYIKSDVFRIANLNFLDFTTSEVLVRGAGDRIFYRSPSGIIEDGSGVFNTRQINAGAGLSGGGNLTSDRTISLGDINLTWTPGTGLIYGGDWENNFTPRTLVTQQYVTSEIIANAYVHPTFTNFTIDATGAQVIDEVTTTTEGHVSNITLRNLTLADLGFTGDTDANNYVHPSYTAQNPTLTGALVLASIETDSIGSVVSITTRTLSPADINAININQLGVPNGVATLDGSGALTESQLPASILGGVKYIDNWDASTNTPTLPDPTTVKGNYYVVTVGATVTGPEYDGGSIEFNPKDWVISNGTVWKKVDNTDSVASVFGRQGNILALAGDYASFYVRHDVNTQGLTITQQGNARTNINAQQFITGGATTITLSNLTANRALISNGSGKVAVSAVTSTELGYLDGVTSGIQDQLDSKLEANEVITLSGDVTGSGQTSIATTISNNAVTTTKVLDKNITYAKIQDVSANRILGQTATTGTVKELTAAEVRNIINVADGANNYTHPSYTTRNVTLSGATVLASFTSDSIGSVTGITTRTLTPADIGAQPAGTYVTSVGLSLPSIFNVTGSPVTSSGTLTATLNTQNAYRVFATGSDNEVPTFQSLVVNHLPNNIPFTKLEDVAENHLLGRSTGNGKIQELSASSVRSILDVYTTGEVDTLLGGYVPTSRAITINGVTQNLSANRTWSVGTVTSITAGGGLTGGIINSSGTISHADTSSQSSSSNANGSIIQNIGLDTYGHVTSLTPFNGDDRWTRRHVLINSQSEWLYTSEASTFPGIHVGQITTGSSNFPSTLGGFAIFGGAQTNATSYYARVFGFFRQYDSTNVYVGTANDNGANNGWALIYTSYNLNLSTLGGVPTTRTITINGVTQDLSVDRTWTIPTHDPITLGTANGLSLSGQELSLGLASSGVTGALSGTDWDTFNNKIGGSGTTNYIPKFTGAGTIGNSAIYESVGNIGVNTIPDSWAVLRVIQFNGGAFFGENPRFTAFIGHNLYYNGINYIYKRNGLASINYQLNGSHYWVNTVSGLAGNTATLVERMRLTSTGQLWIGTISGTNTLDVNGTARIRTINNLGTTATEVLVPDALGVVSKRTVAEFKSDLGVVESINAGAGIQVNPTPTASTPQVALTGQALSFHSVTGDGFVYRTSGIVGTRELVAGTGISITNGDGISGNPVISANMPLQRGTFTPTLSGYGLTYSYTSQSGFYTQIDDLVFVYIRIVFSATGTPTGGRLRVSGLPVQGLASEVQRLPVLQMQNTGWTNDEVSRLVFEINGNLTYGEIAAINSSGFAAPTFSSVTALTIQGVYKTSSP